MRKIAITFLALIGVVVLGGCGYGGSSTSTSTNMPAQTGAQTPVSGNAVNIQNFTFSPAALTVAKGTTVTWTNNDPAAHQIKSATFNSTQLNKGQTFSFTFNDAGTFDYSCAIHPSMLGKIIVQ
jgi:plastocyanin